MSFATVASVNGWDTSHLSTVSHRFFRLTNPCCDQHNRPMFFLVSCAWESNAMTGGHINRAKTLSRLRTAAARRGFRCMLAGNQAGEIKILFSSFSEKI